MHSVAGKAHYHDYGERALLACAASGQGYDMFVRPKRRKYYLGLHELN